MALKTGAATRANDGRVPDAGWEDEPIARGELDRALVRSDQEGDRAFRADEELRGRVLVCGVPIARTVAPGVGSNAGVLEALARGRHPSLPAAPVGKRLQRLGDHSKSSAAR